jgi:hypothetical protein
VSTVRQVTLIKVACTKDVLKPCPESSRRIRYFPTRLTLEMLCYRTGCAPTVSIGRARRRRPLCTVGVAKTLRASVSLPGTASGRVPANCPVHSRARHEDAAIRRIGEWWHLVWFQGFPYRHYTILCVPIGIVLRRQRRIVHTRAACSCERLHGRHVSTTSSQTIIVHLEAPR